MNGERAYRDVVAAVAGGVGYVLLAVGTLLLTAEDAAISAIWPANALLLALILPLERWRWPLYFAAAFVGNLLVNVVLFQSVLTPALYGLSNMAEVLIAALLLGKRQAPDAYLDDVGSVMRFALFGGLIAPILSGLAGATIASTMLGKAFWPSYATWYIADALGLLIFTPLFSGIVSGELSRWVREMLPTARIEAAALLLLTLVATLLTFLVDRYPLLFLTTAMIMFITFRLGRFGTKISLIMAALIGANCTMHGLGPIAAMVHERAEQALFLQFYLAVMLVAALPISAELHARHTLARRLAASEATLSIAASTDSLTGALNHAAFMAHLDRALARPAPTNLALLMIDVDHFKQVNDRHGHPAGDAVLIELAARLRRLIRDADVIGRLGGDELAILLDGADEGLALSIAEALRAEISARPIILGKGEAQPVSISCGVAQAHPGMARGELLRRADEALYRAKGEGRDRVVISTL